MKLTTVMAGLVPAIHAFLEAEYWRPKTRMPGTRPGMTQRLAALNVTRLYIGRTSTTSGTKCRSRFWMPCLSVAVEDGQPEQAPFMFR